MLTVEIFDAFSARNIRNIPKNLSPRTWSSTWRRKMKSLRSSPDWEWYRFSSHLETFQKRCKRFFLCDQTELSKVIAKQYNEMNDRKKQKYTEQAKKEKELFELKLKKFMWVFKTPSFRRRIVQISPGSKFKLTEFENSQHDRRCLVIGWTIRITFHWSLKRCQWRRCLRKYRRRSNCSATPKWPSSRARVWTATRRVISAVKHTNSSTTSSDLSGSTSPSN